MEAAYEGKSISDTKSMEMMRNLNWNKVKVDINFDENKAD